jgi:hypothetical protein
MQLSLDLIADGDCGTWAFMSSFVRIVRNKTMTRIGWVAEDIAR